MGTKLSVKNQVRLDFTRRHLHVYKTCQSQHLFSGILLAPVEAINNAAKDLVSKFSTLSWTVIQKFVECYTSYVCCKYDYDTFISVQKLVIVKILKTSKIASNFFV